MADKEYIFTCPNCSAELKAGTVESEVVLVHNHLKAQHQQDTPYDNVRWLLQEQGEEQNKDKI